MDGVHFLIRQTRQRGPGGGSTGVEHVEVRPVDSVRRHVDPGLERPLRPEELKKLAGVAPTASGGGSRREVVEFMKRMAEAHVAEGKPRHFEIDFASDSIAGFPGGIRDTRTRLLRFVREALSD
ncbi:hypothetical protein HY572_00370 [Candidatus Micrarchaeota archaeon]|nr:hypothetical protein [Candidatus Micrarchaeota archaeon]